MKVTTERLENCQVNIFVELDAAEVDEKLRTTARKVSRQFNVPGYRRGHAPFAAVIRTFGREALQQETFEDIGQELYEQALKEIEYEPYQPGELQEVKWDPFRMTVSLPIKPVVDLGDYRAARVPFETPPVTDQQVADALAQVQRERAQWVPAERPAAMGDQVVIDAKGWVGDEEILSDDGREMVLEAEDVEPAPGYHAAIVGMSPGEEKTFTLTFSENDPQKDLAGKEGFFEVRVHEVKRRDLPPLDDDLAAMVGDYESLDALKAALRQGLETETARGAEGAYLDKVLDAMIEKAAKIEYPPQAIDREADLAVERMESNLAGSGLQLDTYLKMIGKTREQYKADFRPAAEQRLRKRLALVEIAKREGLQVKPEEIDGEMSRLQEMLGEPSEQVRKFLGSQEGYLSVADDLIMTKVQERVILIGKGEAPPLEPKPEGETEPAGAAEAEGQTGVEVASEESEPAAVAAEGAELSAAGDQPGSVESS